MTTACRSSERLPIPPQFLLRGSTTPQPSDHRESVSACRDSALRSVPSISLCSLNTWQREEGRSDHPPRSPPPARPAGIAVIHLRRQGHDHYIAEQPSVGDDR